MFGMFGSFFSSLVSYDFYNWAANVRRGTGLSYLAGIVFVFLAVIAGTFLYKLGFEALKAMVYSMITNEMVPAEVNYVGTLMPREIFSFLAVPLFFWAVLTLFLFNLAVILSVTIGQIMNYLFGEPHEFTAILRINCYITILSTTLTTLWVYFFPNMYGNILEIFLTLTVIYNFYGVMFPKFDL